MEIPFWAFHSFGFPLPTSHSTHLYLYTHTHTHTPTFLPGTTFIHEQQHILPDLPTHRHSHIYNTYQQAISCSICVIIDRYLVYVLAGHSESPIARSLSFPGLMCCVFWEGHGVCNIWRFRPKYGISEKLGNQEELDSDEARELYDFGD